MICKARYFLALAFLAAGIFGQTHLWADEKELNSLKLYRNDTYRFEFSNPENWAVVISTTSKPSFIRQLPHGKSEPYSQVDISVIQRSARESCIDARIGEEMMIAPEVYISDVPDGFPINEGCGVYYEGFVSFHNQNCFLIRFQTFRCKHDNDFDISQRVDANFGLIKRVIKTFRFLDREPKAK